MCRNITELRGLEPPATHEEAEAAASQFVRKVTGATKPTGAVEADIFEDLDAVLADDGRGAIEAHVEIAERPQRAGLLERPVDRVRIARHQTRSLVLRRIEERVALVLAHALG